MSDLSTDQYLTLAQTKLEVARRHLIELESDLPSASVSDPASATDSRAGIEGHADGCVTQAYAAFDTYACAVARHFGLAKPDRASLNGLVARLSEPSLPSADGTLQTCVAVREVVESSGWSRLSVYRNLAVHRGVVAGRTHFSLETGFTLRISDMDGPDPRGAEAVPILRELLGWAEKTLLPLVTVAEGWPDSEDLE